MENINYEALKKELKKEPKILITTHRSPDGDAMGSSLALYQVLKALNHTVSLIVPNSYAQFLNWLPCNNEVLEYEGNEEKANKLIDAAELIFCLDFNHLSRTEMMQNSLEKAQAKFVMIDHHQDPSDFSDFTYSAPHICSTAQMMYEFIENMGWIKQLSLNVAKCLYTGLVTDTGSFRFPSVDSRTHEITSNLIQIGLQPSEIHQKLFDGNKESKLKLLGYCLNEKLEVLKEYHTAIMSLNADELNRFNFEKGDTEGFVNYALSIENVVFTAFFIQYKEKIKISFRSLHQFPANLLSKKHFNGGGHINAAGGVFIGNIDDAITKFKNILPEYKKELSSNC